MRFLSTLIAVLVLTGPACADWQLQCDADKCRAFTFTDKDVALRRIRFVVEFTDRRRFMVSALMAREQYQRDLTSGPPTYETFGGQEYVREPNFFGSKLRARVRVDGQLIATARPGPKGFIDLGPADFYLLVDAVKHGHALQVEYAVGSDGYGPSLSYDLTGLQGALSKFRQGWFVQFPNWPPSRPPFVERDEVETVALLLDVANQHAVRSADLSAAQNPHGSGSFVYVKGREGFIWLVNDGDVVAVSAWAKNVTPDALEPYEVTAGFWRRPASTRTAHFGQEQP